MIYDLVASFKAEKSKVYVGDAWFRVSPISVSFFLSLPLSQSWSSGLRVSFVFFPLSIGLSLKAFLSSDRIKLGFLCFLPPRSRIGRKITF